MTRLYTLLREVSQHPGAFALVCGFAVLILDKLASVVKAFAPHITINKTTHIHNGDNDEKKGNNDGK